MKKILVFTLALFSLNLLAQDKEVELNCYNKWAAKFEERGADAVADGTYDDVIITVRQGSKATCYKGKAEVASGKVIRFYTLLDDGTYEEFKRNWKPKATEEVTITNGISKSMMSVYGELVNVLWPKKIKPKKAKPSAAPDPSDD